MEFPRHWLLVLVAGCTIFSARSAVALTYAFTSNEPGVVSGTLEIDSDLGEVWGTGEVIAYSIYYAPWDELIDSTSTDPVWSVEVYGAVATANDPFDDFSGGAYLGPMLFEAWEDKEYWVDSHNFWAVFQPGVPITWQLVPEPTTGLLVLAGLIGCSAARSTRRRGGCQRP